MGTLKSNKGAAKYIGGASIFSGCPDPTWDVSQVEAQGLETLWNSMEPYTGALPSAPVLGYRGAFLRESNQREWVVYGGVVTLKTPEGSQSRRDHNREFEALLLSSAPKGAIPLQLVDAELRR